MEAAQEGQEQKRFIGIRQVTEIAGFSKSSILRKVAAHEFPAPVIHQGNVSRWDLAEVLRWRAAMFAKRDERSRATA